MRERELLSVVALLEDVPLHSLRRGEVGTIVERLSPGIYRPPRRSSGLAGGRSGTPGAPPLLAKSSTSRLAESHES